MLKDITFKSFFRNVVIKIKANLINCVTEQNIKRKQIN